MAGAVQKQGSLITSCNSDANPQAPVSSSGRPGKDAIGRLEETLDSPPPPQLPLDDSSLGSSALRNGRQFPITIRTGTLPQTPSGLHQGAASPRAPGTASLLTSLCRACRLRPRLVPTPACGHCPVCLWVCECELMTVDSRKGRESGAAVPGKDLGRRQKGPRLQEPGRCRCLSVPIRRAIGLAGYFICVYLSVFLCLALSSDVSVSQPSDAPSAGASFSEDRLSPHPFPGGQPCTRANPAKTAPWPYSTLQFAFLDPTRCLIISPPCSRRSLCH